MPVRIESIVDHLELVDTLARWHWNEWGHTDPGGSLEAWTANLRTFTRCDAIPTMWIALEGDEPLGSVTLNAHDMTTHRDLSPWLSGLYVKPSARDSGVGAALVRHMVERVAHMGIEDLYLYTRSARGLYEKLGWTVIEEDDYEGRSVWIMTTETAAVRSKSSES